jgi:hypothetical protein
MDTTTDVKEGMGSSKSGKRSWLVALGAMFFIIVGLKVLSEVIRSPHTQALKTACMANLRAVQEVKAIWASHNLFSSNAIPTWTNLIGVEYLRERPQCPSGGDYTLGAVKDRVQCSVEGHTL